MAITMNGKLANTGNLKGLNGVFKNTASGYTALYMGFITGGTPIADDSTVAGLSECTGVARVDITSLLGSPALYNGVPAIRNSSAIASGNATAAEAITGWFLTNTSSGAGDLIAYSNKGADSLNTNVGSPIQFDANALTITQD
jgi:hypothetical protein